MEGNGDLGLNRGDSGHKERIWGKNSGEMGAWGGNKGGGGENKGIWGKKGQFGAKIRREMRAYVGNGANERRFGVKKGHLGQK